MYVLPQVYGVKMYDQVGPGTEREYILNWVVYILSDNLILGWEKGGPLHPAPCALRPAPCALPPAPCALRPAPCALRPAPCTLRPAPCALRPAPCKLTPHVDFGGLQS